jgi:methylenetetrahydrofolate dehydrogenase (NADP+)/methenyltetrahydrofolate cyclohydrolase
MQLLDGKIASAAILQKIKGHVATVTIAGKRKPHLAAILIGNNGASETYVASKVKTCTEIGFDSTLIRFSNDIAEKELLQKIESLNEDENIDGILVQLPLPKHIAEEKIIHAITPHKDVDGFHPYNVGMMTSGAPTFIPATPYGILLMLDYYKIPTQGKHAVVIGRSHIVGTPMSILLSRKGYPGDCTVTLCHSGTTNLKEITLQADILIAALGKIEFVTEDMVKPGVVIIDVGITRVPDASKKSGFSIKGDVKFDEVASIASAITPVPGGVGLMTIAGLMMNTWNAYQKHIA